MEPAGLRVLSVTEAGVPNEAAWRILEARGVAIHRIRLSGLHDGASRIARKIGRYLPPAHILKTIVDAADRFDPHLVHMGTGRPVALAVLRALGGRKALPMAIEQGAIGGVNALSPIDWLTFYNRRISRVIVPSYAPVNQWIGSWSHSRLGAKAEVVPHPVVVPPPTDRAYRDALRDRLGLPRDAFVVGTVCSIRPIKNVAFLARAVAAMRHDALCAIVGPGNEAALREVRLAGGDRVRLLGRQPGAETMPVFDCYATPTRHPGESFGLATAEAMAAGVPVLATNVGGSGDLVRGGTTGYSLPLVEADWTAALDTLAGDEALRIRLGEAGRMRIATEFSPEVVADQTLSVWMRMVAGRRA